MEPFIGEIMMFSGDFAPTGWALCNGQLLQIAQYSALFSVIGNRFGGDGRTTFAVPDLRGRVPINYGTGPGLQTHALGQSGGTETVQLQLNEMPAHTHTVAPACSNTAPSVGSPVNAVPADLGRTATFATTANATMANTTSAIAGGSAAHNNMQPYLAINFIIALQGIYPSRD